MLKRKRIIATENLGSARRRCGILGERRTRGSINVSTWHGRGRQQIASGVCEGRARVFTVPARDTAIDTIRSPFVAFDVPPFAFLAATPRFVVRSARSGCPIRLAVGAHLRREGMRGYNATAQGCGGQRGIGANFSPRSGRRLVLLRSQLGPSAAVRSRWGLAEPRFLRHHAKNSVSEHPRYRA